MRTPRTEVLDAERSALVAQWWGLVAWSLKRHPWAGEAMGDVAEGVATDALVDAARMFDPARGKFSTFAVKVIWSALRREAERDGVVRRLSGGRDGAPPVVTVSLSGRSGRDDREFQFAAPDAASAVEPDEVDRVRRAIRRLTPRQAKVIRMRFYAGMTLAEVAGDLGVSAEAVRILQARATEKLRRSLAGLEGDWCRHG